MLDFFIVIPIGLEDLALKEIQFKFPKHFDDEEFNAQAIKGGINLTCKKECGLALNSILKIPTRILLRLKAQKCRDLPKLFNIIKKINWKEYLRQTNCDFSISCSQSRLMHTGRIDQTAKDALSFYFNANKIPQKNLLENCSNQSIYIRIDNDDLTISLDTTGEPLYKRNNLTYRGLAGLRENYASGFLLSLLGFQSYTGYTLMDPMAGSGTFLREASNFFTLNKRAFSYLNWLKISKLNLKDLENIWNFRDIIGHDIDNTVLENSTPDVKITRKDFFLQTQLPEKTIIIVNPPYGKRIKINNIDSYFLQLIKHMTKLSPVTAGLIVPRDHSKHIKSKKRINFNQNGIKVEFLQIQTSKNR